MSDNWKNRLVGLNIDNQSWSVKHFLDAISKMSNGSFDRLMTLSEIEGPISASGLNRNPQNIYIYSSGYDSAPSLTSNYFSIFEMASNQNLRT